MKTKKLISILLSVITLITLVPVNSASFSAVAEVKSNYNVGDIIEFGSYPQSEIQDISNLNEGTDYIVYEGKYYKIEPIRWIVLQNDNGKLFIWSQKSIDESPYNDTSEDQGSYYANNYEMSVVRSMLIGSFYNTAFDAREKSYIYPTTIDNSAVVDKYSADPTTDSVFLISKSEAESLGKKYLAAELTDYTAAHGIEPNSDGLLGSLTRTAANNNYSIYYIEYKWGSYIVYYNWYDDAITVPMPVRPAMYIDSKALEPQFHSITVQGCYLTDTEKNKNTTESCENDAASMYSCFVNNTLNGYNVASENQHFFKFAIDNSYQQFKNYIVSCFFNTKDNDITVFYYTGHAAKVNGGLCPDGSPIIKWSDLAQFLSQKIKGKIVVILDCCFSRQFITNGLSSLSQSERNRFSVLVSCDEGETSQAEPHKSLLMNQSVYYGWFTYYLLHGVGFFSSRSKADLNNNGVTLNELKDYISLRTMLKLMHPEVENGSEILFNTPTNTGSLFGIRFKHSINCPVDIAVYNNNTGELEGQIINNVVDESIDNKIEMSVDGDEKVFYTSYDNSYRIVLTGNDDGYMNYTVSEIDNEKGEIDRVNFYNVELKDGLIYTGTVSDYDFTLYNYYLEGEDGQIITYDEYITENELNTVSLTVLSTGRGTATDSMVVTSGDFAYIEARESDCGKFTGWYIDDTLISTDKTYRICVNQDICITAVFEDDHSYVKETINTPSCVNYGTNKYVCSVCGDYYEEKIPLVSHEDKDNDGRCDICNENISVIDVEQHDICKYCGKTHTGLLGGIIKIIHNVFYFFRQLFK
ncbi:MAG: caspase family protein [Clostridia bacterium]|nr:caspase family protein [Clostridia bacterium]